MMPLLGQLAYEGIFGGAMYDALIGCTAQKAGVQLVTLDARARRTYDAVGAQTLMLAS